MGRLRTGTAPGLRTRREGTLATVTSEKEGSEESEGVEGTLREFAGTIHADLSVGADVAGTEVLRANERLSSQGVTPLGLGFRLEPGELAGLLAL